MSLGQWVGTKVKSGPAAVGVLGSSLVGSMTGSTVANVLITGVYTIPLMKRSGYTPEQAGAIEAAASNGGQIIPPILGAAAFIMAGWTGIPYIEIVKACVVPALLYVGGVFLYVELTARRINLKPFKTEEVTAKKLLLDAPLFVIPLGVMIYLLLEGFSLPFIGFWSIATIVIVSLISHVRKDFRLSRAEVLEGLKGGVKTACEIAVVTATVGIIATCIKVSGLGIKIPMMVREISQGYLFIALLIGMLSSLILGVGVPAVVAYILVAIGIAPALVEMGVPLIAAHLFCFYFAIYANLTPPVAIGSLVASRVAKSDYWKTSMEALKASFTGALLPFFIIYAPVLLLSVEGSGILAIAQIAAVVIGITSLQMGLSRYSLTNLRRTEIILFIVAALLCFTFIYTKVYYYLIIGVALFALSFARQLLIHRG